METAKLENWTFEEVFEECRVYNIQSLARASKGLLLRGSWSHLLPSLMQLSGKLLNIMSTVLILNVPSHVQCLIPTHTGYS